MLLIVGVVAAIVVFVDSYVMTSDALAPEVREGDHLVTLKATLLALDVDDIVSYERDDVVLLRRISRIEGERIWVRDGASEVELSRDEITGKVVHIIEASPS